MAFITRILGPDGVSFGRTAKVRSAVQGQVAPCGACCRFSCPAALPKFIAGVRDAVKIALEMVSV